ncbi:MAG: GHMP kinase [candidate division WOR-3 bacterium]
MAVIIRARAPLRISFAGGGTDVAPYFEEHSGAVLSATISRYAYATLQPRSDSGISVSSLDYDLTINFDINDPLVYDGQLDLAKGVIRHFRNHGLLQCGADIHLHNDAPPGSGLGSSSALTVALIQAIAEHIRLPVDSYETAELAYQIERKEVGIKGGKQDQYACTFGGINFIEFHRNSTVVNPLRVKPETVAELEYSLVFAYVGGVHFSAHIIDNQMSRYSEGKPDAVSAFHQLKQLAYDAKQALLLGRLGTFGELLDSAWQAKRQLTDEISNPRIDEIYDSARRAGALGGKLSGAGGGGFMFFFCEPTRRFAVQDALRKHGAEIVQFSFTSKGVQAWTAAR